MHAHGYCIFQNQRTLYCLGVALSGLALPYIVMSRLVLPDSDMMFFVNYKKNRFIFWGCFAVHIHLAYIRSICGL